jgi:protein TonB
MQRSPLTSRDRAGAILGVGLVHLAILLAVLNAAQVSVGGREAEPPIETFDVIEPPPPPPPVVEEVKTEPKPREEGQASPPNLVSKATPVVVPPPKVELPRPTPVVASPTPAQGTQPTQGAAPVPGPGTGAGGIGSGTGGGGAGSGSGGGGGSGQGGRPSLISRSLRAGDYPGDLRRRWPPGGRVLVTFSVQLDGRASGCIVYTSSGDPAIDAETCRLVERKLRFRPARNAQGQPYVEKYGYMQAPVNF